MATFSTNEVRQLWIANATSGTNPGTYVAVKTFNDKLFYLEFINADGQTVKTDYINVDKIRYAKAKAYVAQTFRQDTITINDVVPGQDYIVRILFRGWGSGSAEDQYFKFLGAYTAKAGDTAENIIDALIELGQKNFAREDANLLSFTKTGTGASAAMVVTELPQDWVLGKKQARPLDYTIQFVPITVNGVDTVDWATITNNAQSNAGVGTPQLSADLEYFYLGERGDTYRNVGWPYTWNTKYLVNMNTNYDAIELAYYFSDEAHAVQASEKQLTILASRGTADDSTIANAIIAAINTVVPSLITPL